MSSIIHWTSRSGRSAPHNGNAPIKANRYWNRCSDFFFFHSFDDDMPFLSSLLLSGFCVDTFIIAGCLRTRNGSALSFRCFYLQCVRSTATDVADDGAEAARTLIKRDTKQYNKIDDDTLFKSIVLTRSHVGRLRLLSARAWRRQCYNKIPAESRMQVNRIHEWEIHAW